MTADDRLNQLEPVLAESITILDRHTFQLKQLSNAVSELQGSVSTLQGNVTTLLAASVRHSDDISFLLREQAEIKSDVATLKTDVATLKTDVATLKTDVDSIKTDITGIKTEQTSMNSKLDLLIQLLQKPGQ